MATQREQQNELITRAHDTSVAARKNGARARALRDSSALFAAFFFLVVASSFARAPVSRIASMRRRATILCQRTSAACARDVAPRCQAQGQRPLHLAALPVKIRCRLVQATGSCPGEQD